MSQFFRATNSMLPTEGPDAEQFATRWDGQYCESIPSNGEYKADFSLVWNVRDMDFAGGPNGILWLKGRDFVIQHTAHNLVSVSFGAHQYTFLHSDTRGKWQQLAIVRRGNWLEFWDGPEKKNEIELDQIDPVGGGNVLIGYTNQDRYFRGYLFDMRIYKDAALEAADLQYLFTDARTYGGERTLPRVNYGTTPRASD